MIARRSLGTVVLAGALFVYLTAEMFPVGVLPELANGLRTSEATAGSLLTVYAAIAGLAIIPAVAVTRQWNRRTLIVGSLVLLGGSQVAFAMASDLQWALVARAVGAVPHGVLWSVVPAVAASLWPTQPGRATARVFIGGSLALVGGAPAMTALTQAVGWRWAAVSLGLGAWVVAVGASFLLPATPTAPTLPVTVGKSISKPIALIGAVTIAVVTANYIPYTYLASLADEASIRATGLATLQIGYGAAGLIAVALVGRLLDTRIPTALGLVLTGLIAALATIAVSPGPAVFVVAVAVWGAAFACAAPTLQTAVLRTPGADPVSASAVYVLAFQIGITAGSWTGSLTVDTLGIKWLAACGIAGATVAAFTALPLRRSIRAGTNQTAPNPAAPKASPRH